MQDDAKPVAWMYENEEGSKELILNCNSEYAQRLLEFGYVETPLYALPPAPAQPELVERVALAILNSDREMAGLGPIESCFNVPDSDGYVVNARAALAAMPVGDDTGTLVDRDQAHLALFNAIRAIEIGNPTDDKLILENLRKAGFWLCKIGSLESTVAKATGDSLTPPADADAGLVEALEESRRWEAKLILDERPWVVDSGVHIPQDLWDEYISTVQTKREAALGQGGVR